LVRFAAAAAATLAPQLGSTSLAEATALINAVRGRLGSSAAAPQGSGERDDRLGAISHSTPALVGASSLIVAARERDRVLYVGSDSGLLHAFLAGSASAPTGTGRELWGYLPGSLLPALRRQAWAEATALATVRVDGSPAVSDQFADFDGDGRREWRTVLVGTASAAGVGGVVFALDVSDPYQPRVLWERGLAPVGLGVSRGVAMTVPGRDGALAPRVFLTGAGLQRKDATGGIAPYNGAYGVLACALDLVDGSLLWDFYGAYAAEAANLNAPPAPPALMRVNGKTAWVLFGDMAGRLWAVDPATGRPMNGGPVYRLPAGSRTPLAAGVAVQGRTVVFGSGGAEHVDPVTAQAM
jgi:Tfp pilus tip-associated adhesin PilY1